MRARTMKDQDDIIGANALRDLARTSAHGAYRDALIRCAAHLATLSPPEAQGSRDRDVLLSQIAAARLLFRNGDCADADAELAKAEAHLESQGTASAASQSRVLSAIQKAKAVLSPDEVERVVEELWKAEAASPHATALREFVQELADDTCHYKDNCPVFSSKHGRCIVCKARDAIVRSTLPPSTPAPNRTTKG